MLKLAALCLLLGLTVGVISDPRDAPGEATSTSHPEVGEALANGPSPPLTNHNVVVGAGPEFPSTLMDPPTADPVQSKLWFHDDRWWGLLIDPSTASVRLFRLDLDARSWTSTELLIDERSTSRADVLWDGVHLYVASGGPTSTDADHVRIMRYSYDTDAQEYSLDPAFPIRLTDSGVSSLMVAKDTAGVVWVSYISQGKIWLSHSGVDDFSWSDPFPLLGAGDSPRQDIAVLVSYGARLGLAWINEADGAVYFTSHRDADAPDAWDPATTILADTLLADDHITARSLSGPEGSSVFLMVKTSLDVRADRQPSEPQMLLLERRPDGQWRSHVYGRLQDRHTRPLLVINEETRELYIFAVSPFGTGSVYYKRTSADRIELAAGKGTPFLLMADRPAITYPTSTKQNVNLASGTVVLAADMETSHYVYGVLPGGELKLP